MGKKLVTLVLSLVLVMGLASSALAETIKLPKAMEALTVRSGPGTDYEPVAWLQDGSEVKLISASGAWSKVKAIYNGKTGYIRSAYIRQAADTETPVKTGTATAGRVTGKSVNLRTLGSTTGKVVRSLPSGTKLKIWDSKGNWHYVTTLSGTSGWISKTYVKEGFTSKTTARVNLRKSANGELIKTLNKGASVSVISMTGAWSKVKVDGQTGYVFTKYLGN